MRSLMDGFYCKSRMCDWGKYNGKTKRIIPSVHGEPAEARRESGHDTEET
jgi:hypothetical protein